MPKEPWKESAQYKADQQTSKQNLKDLVLRTKDVREIDNELPRVDRLANNWTAKSLFASTVSFKSWRKKYSKPGSMVLRKPVPYRGTSSVLFNATFKGVSQYPDTHRVVILFSGLKFAAEPFKDCLHVEYKGTVYYVEKPSLSKTTIRVRCSCKDFYFCFSFWDYLNRAIVGPKPKKYTRKTPPPSQGGRPEVNPNHFVGYCKHTFYLLKYLKQKGWVTT